MKDIEFIEKDGVYVADFESEGKCVVQVDNGTTDNLFLYRHMPDMEPSSYDKLDFVCHQRVFDLDVPAGMMIRIISKTEVKAAKMALCPQSGSGSESAPTPDLSEYAKKEELDKLVVSEITNGDAGKALVFNESDGGGAKFEGAEYDSFSGVNDGKTGNGARALMYVKKKGTGEGPKVFLTGDKAYYTKGTDYATGDGGEIAVKDDLKEYSKDVLPGVGEGDKAWCHNHRNGGSVKYVKKDGKTAIVSVDGQNGLLAQVACKDGDNEGATRTGIIVKEKAAYYLKNKAGITATDDEEIATKADLKGFAASSSLENLATKTELANKADTSDIPEKLPNPQKLTIKYNGVQAFEYDGSKAETGNFIVNAETVPMSGSDGTFISAKIAALEARIQALEEKHVEP